MPSPRHRPTGPADTTAPGVQVTSSTPAPTARDLRRGVTAAVTALPEPAIAPLVLTDAPRVEEYDTTAPGGITVHVVHNVDTGQRSYTWHHPEPAEPDGTA